MTMTFCLWYGDTSLAWKESKSLDFFITESILNSELEGIFCIQLGRKDFHLQMHASFLLWNVAVWSFKLLGFSIFNNSSLYFHHSSLKICEFHTCSPYLNLFPFFVPITNISYFFYVWVGEFRNKKIVVFRIMMAWW